MDIKKCHYTKSNCEPPINNSQREDSKRNTKSVLEPSKALMSLSINIICSGNAEVEGR